MITWTRTAALTPDELETLRERPRQLTIVLERQADRVGLRLYNNGRDLGFHEYQLNDGMLKNSMSAIRRRLTEMMDAYKGENGGNKTQLAHHLGRLAERGYGFYGDLFPALIDPNGAGPTLDLAPGQVIQIAPLSAQLSVPWEILYDRPIESYEQGVIRLCESYQTHGPDPQDCPAYGDPQVVCPHGFWGYRYIIEQLPCRVEPNMPPSAETLPLQVHNRVPLQFNAIVYTGFTRLKDHLIALGDMAPGKLDLLQLADRQAVRQALNNTDHPPDVIYF